ncbi:hypothetical protein ACWCQR_35135, partial [Streptomyces sp. NPDC002172]
LRAVLEGVRLPKPPAAGRQGDQGVEPAGVAEGEETGHTVGEVEHVFDVYMSPGSVTERISFYAAAYGPSTRTHEGGGLDEEGEDIEILELPFRRALEMIRTGEIADAKTIMLLQWAALDGPFARHP